MARDGLLREIRRRALEQNWRIERCANGHPKFLAPDGRNIVIASGTPSDHRAVNELLADLKRAGFVLHDGGRRPDRRHVRDERPTNTRFTTPHQMEMEMDTPVKESRSSNGAPPPQPERVPFHVALRREREASRLSRKDLAEMLKVSPNTIANWEVACGTTPGAASYVRVCEVYPALRDVEPTRKAAAPKSVPARRNAASAPASSDSIRMAMRLLMQARKSAWRGKAAAVLGVAISAGLSITDVHEWLR